MDSTKPRADHGLIKSLDIQGNPAGPLAGLDIVVKDLSFIAGPGRDLALLELAADLDLM